jgi:CO/xanthine dehydrogenase Mo-binding subunit
MQRQGRPHRREQFRPVPAVAHEGQPAEINIRFFKSGHWLDGMGHDRATSIQSAICDAVFQVTGKRYRDLPLRNHDLTWT